MKTKADLKSPPRRRIMLIEVLVALAIVAFLFRLVYYLTHWQDSVRSLHALTAYDVVAGVLFSVVYYFLNRWARS